MAAQVVEHLKTVLKDPGSNPTDGWPYSFFFDFTLESSIEEIFFIQV